MNYAVASRDSLKAYASNVGRKELLSSSPLSLVVLPSLSQGRGTCDAVGAFLQEALESSDPELYSSAQRAVAVEAYDRRGPLREGRSQYLRKKISGILPFLRETLSPPELALRCELLQACIDYPGLDRIDICRQVPAEGVREVVEKVADICSGKLAVTQLAEENREGHLAAVQSIVRAPTLYGLYELCGRALALASGSRKFETRWRRELLKILYGTDDGSGWFHFPSIIPLPVIQNINYPSDTPGQIRKINRLIIGGFFPMELAFADDGDIQWTFADDISSDSLGHWNHDLVDHYVNLGRVGIDSLRLRGGGARISRLTCWLNNVSISVSQGRLLKLFENSEGLLSVSEAGNFSMVHELGVTPGQALSDAATHSTGIISTFLQNFAALYRIKKELPDQDNLPDLLLYGGIETLVTSFVPRTGIRHLAMGFRMLGIQEDMHAMSYCNLIIKLIEFDFRLGAARLLHHRNRFR